MTIWILITATDNVSRSHRLSCWPQGAATVMQYLSWSSGKSHDTMFASTLSSCRGHVIRDKAEQWLDGWMVPTLCSWWAGEDLSEKPLREGKRPHFPTSGNGPWCQDTSVSGLLMPQESCMFPGVCSLTPSSSLLSSNKIHCWSSAYFVFKTQHLVKSCTQLSRTFEPWPMFLKHLISFWFTSNVCINSTWCICCMFPSTNQ